MREHKRAFHDYIAGLARDAGLPGEHANELGLLAEGAIVTAAIFGEPEAAHYAQSAAQQLINAVL